MDIASVIVTFMLTRRVLPRSIRDTGAFSALPATAPRLFKLPIRPQNTPRSRNRLRSRADRAIQRSFGCICPYTLALSATSFFGILVEDCATKNSAPRNPFGINWSRTLGIFTTKCALLNSFAINSFRTLLQKPGVGTPILPLPLCALRSACGACPDLIGVISVVKSSPAPSHVSRHSSLATFLRCRSVERPLFFNGKRSLSLFPSYRYRTLFGSTRGGIRVCVATSP
jgi:hypothetical protein